MSTTKALKEFTERFTRAKRKTYSETKWGTLLWVLDTSPSTIWDLVLLKLEHNSMGRQITRIKRYLSRKLPSGWQAIRTWILPWRWSVGAQNWTFCPGIEIFSYCIDCCINGFQSPPSYWLYCCNVTNPITQGRYKCWGLWYAFVFVSWKCKLQSLVSLSFPLH